MPPGGPGTAWTVPSSWTVSAREPYLLTPVSGRPCSVIRAVSGPGQRSRPPECFPGPGLWLLAESDGEFGDRVSDDLGAQPAGVVDQGGDGPVSAR